MVTNSRQGLPRNIISNFSEINSWKHLSGSAIILVPTRERKKHPKKICIKNFGGTLAGGSRRGLRRPNSLCRCWFSQQDTVHKEFRGGGLRGSWGWGLRSNFGAPLLYVYVLFWGLTDSTQSRTEKVPQGTCATKILPNFWVNFLV